ncbi:MinD-like ATPase involved in chromosome partitioning or flagellar assembly [Bradyrhizobium sp. S3.9.2]|uniref:tyrosine-protein kinase family protein n=1 Tax=Bradyrhizobium sp. S3.9.2 TaxID=3156432 RepID=UPI00339B388D
MDNRAGKIITFYSYKGGTGRTMALANVGWILASNGYDVLLIDWDLEAPGLHRFLRPFLFDSELTDTPGLIDFVWDGVRVSMTPAGTGSLAAPKFPSLDDYAVVLDHDFADGGSLSLIPAGQQDENYAQRVNTFNWEDFYQRFGGGKLMQAERDALRKRYDYILIDSRTGVSDTSGICTVQMPDILVVLFTLNRQSITGAAAAAASIDATVRAKRNESIPIYPVPTRIEVAAEKERREAVIAYARRAFAPLLTHVQSTLDKVDLLQQSAYWQDVETPYVPFFAFEEILAAFKEETRTRNTVLGANERIAYWVSGRTVTGVHPEDEAWRNAVMGAYALKEAEAPSFEWNPPLRVKRAWGRKVAAWLSSRRVSQWSTAAFACAVVFMGAQWYSASSARQSAESRSDKLRQRMTSVADRVDTEARKLPGLPIAYQTMEKTLRSLAKELQDP